MRGALSFLLRGGAGLLLDTAELYFGRVAIERLKRKLARLLVFYFTLGVLALGAATSLFVLLYQWLAAQFDGIVAAAILFGASLVLIALLFLGRVLLSRRRAPPPYAGGAEGLLMALTGAGEGAQANLEAGLMLGRRIGAELRKAAPEIALVAALLGLITGLLRRRPPRDKPDKRDKSGK